ncbi:MAG: putative transposase/invertase (TIGR01784 family) [Phenylobacterium sp.]|jgi:predicted transposase/invertase (TIGR01784 family)
MARKLISFDWAIKKLLRSKANFGILEGFLSELLFTGIKIVAILESESDRENSKNKQNQVDIKVEDSNGQLILIEVQFSREQDYLFRILFSSAKCLIEHMDKGARYSDVSKVISISILYFDFCAGDDYIYRGTTEFYGLHNNHKLELNTEQKGLFSCEKVADIFPEHYILNIRNFNDIAKEPLDEWIYFLKNEEVKEEFQAKGLIEAKEKLDVLKLDPSEKIDYDRHIHELRREASLYQSSYVLGEMKGLEQGREKGREEAEAISAEKYHQQTIESVKKMLMKGLNVADIVQFTELPEDEIKTIQAQFDK